MNTLTVKNEFTLSTDSWLHYSRIIDSTIQEVFVYFNQSDEFTQFQNQNRKNTIVFLLLLQVIILVHMDHSNQGTGLRSERRDSCILTENSRHGSTNQHLPKFIFTFTGTNNKVCLKWHANSVNLINLKALGLL